MKNWRGLAVVFTVFMTLSAGVTSALAAAEMIGAEFGVGAYILLAGSLVETDQLIAGVALLSLMGLCVAWLIGRIENCSWAGVHNTICN